MCRITLTTEGIAVCERIAHLQRYGGTLPAEFCSAGGCHIGLNRFTVTSERVPHGDFPLVSERYLLAFNGEVYGFRSRAFVDEREHASDGHFAMELLLTHGVRTFLEEADLQGTFLIYDKQDKEWWIAADQMNTAGCFYASWSGKLIVASEYAPIHAALTELGIDEKIPIEVLPPGRALRRSDDGKLYEHSLRPQGITLFSGEKEDEETLSRVFERFHQALSESVRRRIPQRGTVGVLCSGGIDSSIVLALTARYLNQKQQLERLKIFTLGAEEDTVSLDKEYVNLLLASLGIDPLKHLTIISAAELESAKEMLFEQCVFSESPRLITPNPVLRSQVRNVVMMSSLLSIIKDRAPDIISLLSGDGADEILAGYPEMLLQKETPRDVQQEISKRVAQFPLNDGARVAIAAFHGSSAATALKLSKSGTTPVEIRMPFTSHLVMAALREAHPNFLFGEINGERCAKFILRLVGATLTLPHEIIMREKMPFNEGGTGLRNGTPSPLEKLAAAKWMHRHNFVWNGEEISKVRGYYGLPADEPDTTPTPGLTDQMALVLAAEECGAKRLFLGKAFQSQTHAPAENSTHYFPETVISVTL